jgi:hypothetical protein
MTQLRIVDLATAPPRRQREPGDMWRDPVADVDGREAWTIVLPMDDPRIATPGHPSFICWTTTDRSADPPHEMWTVSGTPPNITVQPSIDVMAFEPGLIVNWQRQPPVRNGSYWHGFITNGVLSPPAAASAADWRWIRMANGVTIRVRR